MRLQAWRSKAIANLALLRIGLHAGRSPDVKIMWPLMFFSKSDQFGSVVTVF